MLLVFVHKLFNSHFRVWEMLLVFVHKLFEGFGGCLELAVGFPWFQLSVGANATFLLTSALQ